ncbi:MAG: VOC family protein, partial [Rhodococcus sp. (in: high G+C Gram-positive bacteria)]
ISLAVRDLTASRAFYETLGFTVLDGDEQSWVLLANGAAKIGLFQGMFEKNIITFTPPDARAVERGVTGAGYALESGTEGDAGPTHFMVTDPDGNMVMFDQFE